MSVPEGKRTESKLEVQTKSKEKADECYRSWKAHAKKGNSYNLLKRMDKYYKNLWKE